jgi:hypothetical protein
MKNLKKIGIGLGFLLAVVGFFGLSNSHKAYALTDTDFKNGTYTYTGSIPPTITASVGSLSITFTTSNSGNPTGQTTTFTPSQLTFPDSSGKFCSGSTITYKVGDPTANMDVKWVNNPAGQCDNLSPFYKGSINLAATATANAPTTSCDANFNSPFAWIFCPALTIADDAANQFNSFVNDQLCFNTGPTSSTDGVVCQSSNNNLNAGVKNAWNIFKNIASALIVIVMLAMVFSQAIGGGPFDAYTVRKMLPKLVAAVIIMQLSWTLLKWLIDLSNDVGTAIANLMMAPFGGAANLSLDHIISQALGVHTSTTNNQFALFVVLAGLTGALIMSIPGLLMMALYVVLALFTAFVVLVLRKLVIILLVILAPIALIAWVMPGTDRYWKMWRENFTKLLLMFPMIMALIAVGKIFASITAGNTGATGGIFHPHLATVHLGSIPLPYVSSVTSFVELAIIVGAYFAPFFFLPQTFRWGGTAMNSIGQGVGKAMEKGGKPAKDYLQWRQGLSPWKQARAARRAKQEIRAKTDFYEGLGAGGLTGAYRRARLRGLPPPKPGGIQRERALADSIVRGGAQRAEEEALKEAQAALDHELATDPLAIADHDQYVIDIARRGVGENVHGRERSEADWRAAVEKMIQYGGPNNRVFEELHQQYLSGGHGDAGRAQWEKVMNGVAPSVLAKFPFFYKDREYSTRVDDHGAPRPELGDLSTTISQLSADSFTKDAGIEGEAVETIMGHLSTLIREGDVRVNPTATPTQIRMRADAQRQVTTMYSLFNSAISSESTRTRINPSSARAMRAAIGLNPSGLTAINGGRRVNETGNPRGTGVPEIDSGVIANTVISSGDRDMPGAIRNIIDHVRDDGNLSP